MTSEIRNARVVGGFWVKIEDGWRRSDEGKRQYFGIIADDHPDTAPEIYRTEDDAHKMLQFLKSAAGNRGLIFIYD